MKSHLLALLLVFATIVRVNAQDTFSIVAADSVTGEVGAAGASCLDLRAFPTFTIDFISDLFPGVGAINTQASYSLINKENARARMNAGDMPEQIIDWLVAHDVSGGTDLRQYGIVRLVNGSPRTAGYTGSSCMDYKNHIAGKSYAIQGNVLLGPQVLDSMEARFLREPGDLACKLMAALQGAKIVGADRRCSAQGVSSLFAFVKVSKPTDSFDRPSLFVAVKTDNNSGIEPIDSVQQLFNLAHNCNKPVEEEESFRIFPNPATDILTIRTYTTSPRDYLMLNAVGQVLEEGVVVREKQLNVKGLPGGLYFVRLKSKQTIAEKKFLKL